jgi:hypothetical protein
LLQGCDHGIPTALRDTDGEHDEERIKACLLNNHTVRISLL